LPAGDSPVVHLHPLVALEPNAGTREPIDRFFDVPDREVENRERRGLVVFLGIHEHTSSTSEVEGQHAVLLGDLDPERVGIELLGPRHVIDGESERPSHP